MKVSVLTPNASQNSIGRAYLLAKIIGRFSEVELIGPVFNQGIWTPIENDNSLDIKTINATKGESSHILLKKISHLITGDVVYASKPRSHSFGAGLLDKFYTHKPLILDIDDWEKGFFRDGLLNLSGRQRALKLFHSLSTFPNYRFYWNLLHEQLVIFADQVTVSNRFLHAKFGGTIVWHARDTNVFNPDNFVSSQQKRDFLLPEEAKCVIFLGSPRPYKGLEDLIEAVALLTDLDVYLLIIGIDDDPYSMSIHEKATSLLSHRFIGVGTQPFDQIPKLLAASDVVVIPQKLGPATLGQLPAKLFDAMAMAKPIISTNVSDIPEILDGCGVILDDVDPRSIAAAIRDIFNHPLEAKRMGQEARSTCVEKYSWDAMEKVLSGLLNRYQ